MVEALARLSYSLHSTIKLLRAQHHIRAETAGACYRGNLETDGNVRQKTKKTVSPSQKTNVGLPGCICEYGNVKVHNFLFIYQNLDPEGLDGAKYRRAGAV